MKRNASFYADAIVSSTIDREGHGEGQATGIGDQGSGIRDQE
jgi:hypothetical protein